MTDIVQKLRDWRGMTPVACSEAANEIEKLRAEVKLWQARTVEAADKIADMDRLLEELSEVDEPPKAAEQPGR